jgi:hypothetical protein
MGYLCKVCGQEHSRFPLDITFISPLAYLEVPEDQRDRRGVLTSDACILDGERYFLRGDLCIPVREEDYAFVWGLWAEVSWSTFRRYATLLRSDAPNEPPHAGVLSNIMPGYQGVHGHPVTIHFETDAERPQFTLLASDSRLYGEQAEGVSIDRLFEIAHALLPKDFPWP